MQFEEYMGYRGQGFTPAQAKYLTEPYTGIGHHFPIPQATARDLGLPNWVRDNPLNVLNPSGISRGQFYELHYQVAPSFFGTRFPKSIGGTWEGNALGLQKYGTIGQIWYGSSTPLKITTGTVIVGGGALGGYYLLHDGGGNQ